MKCPKELESFEKVLFHKNIDVNIQPMIYTLRVLWESIYGKNTSSTKENIEIYNRTFCGDGKDTSLNQKTTNGGGE